MPSGDGARVTCYEILPLLLQPYKTELPSLAALIAMVYLRAGQAGERACAIEGECQGSV